MAGEAVKGRCVRLARIKAVFLGDVFTREINADNIGEKIETLWA